MKIEEIVKNKIKIPDIKKRNPIVVASQKRGSAGAGSHESKKYNRKEKYKSKSDEESS